MPQRKVNPAFVPRKPFAVAWIRVPDFLLRRRLEGGWVCFAGLPMLRLGHQLGGFAPPCTPGALTSSTLYGIVRSMKSIFLLAGILCLQVVSAMAADSIYDIPLKDIDGKDTSLKPYQGKVLLIVNVASHCGFTPQYTQLEAVYQKYKDQGLEVLGFPCNQFGAQEPKSNNSAPQNTASLSRCSTSSKSMARTGIRSM